MATDLRLLWDRAPSLAASSDPKAAEELYWREVRARAMKGDLLCYGMYVHGSRAPMMRKLAMAKHALVMAQAMEEHPRTAFVCPPRMGKTSLMRWENELWLGMETERAFAEPGYPVPTALLVMNTAEQAEKECMAIQATIEHNKRYKELFPNVAPDKRTGWTKGHFFLRRSEFRDVPSFFGCGMFGPIQGFGFRKMTMDDGTDQADANSPTKIQTQKDFRFGVFADRLDSEKGQVRDILTRWLQNDMFSVLEKQPSVHTLVMPILDYWRDHPEHGVEGRALWPEVWGEKRVEALRQQKVAAGQAGLWEMTYMCHPGRAEGSMFKRDWLLRGAVPEDLLVIQAVDPASGASARADYFVVATVGLHRATRKFYVLDIKRGRVEGPDQPQFIVDAYNPWRPAFVGIETIFYQSTLLQYMRRSGQLPLKEIPRRAGADVGKKWMRIAGLAARYKEKQIVHPDSDPPWLADYENELCSINFSGSEKGAHQFDDQADAVSSAVDMLSGSVGASSAEPQYASFSVS